MLFRCCLKTRSWLYSTSCSFRSSTSSSCASALTRCSHTWMWRHRSAHAHKLSSRRSTRKSRRSPACCVREHFSSRDSKQLWFYSHPQYAVASFQRHSRNCISECTIHVCIIIVQLMQVWFLYVVHICCIFYWTYIGYNFSDVSNCTFLFQIWYFILRVAVRSKTAYLWIDVIKEGLWCNIY